MSKLYIEREVVEFLCGAAPLDGVWFGDRHPTERGMYWWRKYLQATLSAAAPAVPDAAKELKDMTQSRNFYRQRIDLLVQWQSKMRDPERTIVCDIVANGQTLPDHDGSRYGAPEQVERAEAAALLRAIAEDKTTGLYYDQIQDILKAAALLAAPRSNHERI